jgi:hypothetical protein
VSDLVRIRQLTGSEPAIVVPYANDQWLKLARIEKCEIYALPEKPLLGEEERLQWAELLDPCWWMQLWKRDVTFWPIDIWSGVVFHQILRELLASELRMKTFQACRWVWCDDDNPANVNSVQTIWRLGADGNVLLGRGEPKLKAAE